MVLRPTRHIDHSGDKQMLKYYELFLRTRSGTLTYLSDNKKQTIDPTRPNSKYLYTFETSRLT